MLTRAKTLETKNADGSSTIHFLQEWEDEPCVDCGGESTDNECPRCHKWHHHGRIHGPDGSHLALCRTCCDKRMGA